MRRKIYEFPTMRQILLEEEVVRTSSENSAEIDGDSVYGDDGWKED